MTFRTWLEALQHAQTIPPNEKHQRFFVSDPNNPQQIDAWRRKETKHVFRFPLAKDRFVHFTLNASAKEIVRLGAIQTSTVFAVSLSWGKWFPVVQYNHIINKKQEKLLNPSDLRKQRTRDQMLSQGYTIPDFGKEISAVVFRTEVMPKSANKEEVLWNGPLTIQDAQLVSSRDAIRLLRNTPYNQQVGDEDTVTYF